MNVYLTSAYSDSEPLESMLKTSRTDVVKVHQLVTDASKADIILFVENSRYHDDSFFEQLINNDTVKSFPEKVFMYNPHDHPWYIMRGLYPSMPKKRFDKNCMATVPYITAVNDKIKYEAIVNPELLYSFLGSPNSPVRREILRIKHPKGYVRPTGNFYAHNDFEVEKVEYADILSNSKYVLCPKGAGTSSFRIFEVMQAGRVPVIISDDWVPPEGPEWNKLAVFVLEKDVVDIASILERDQHNWTERATLSRQAWEAFFSPNVIFNYLIDCVVDIKKNSLKLNKSLYISHKIARTRFLFRQLFIQKIKSIINYR
jgi:hypothetical protein